MPAQGDHAKAGPAGRDGRNTPKRKFQQTKYFGAEADRVSAPSSFVRAKWTAHCPCQRQPAHPGTGIRPHGHPFFRESIMSIYAPIHRIGGNGGAPFSNFGANGKLLEKIAVWAGGWQLRGIRVWMSGEQPVTYGTAAGDMKEFTFTPGERITKLSLWGNGAGTRTGAIRFETSTGRTFMQKMTDWGLKTEYPIEVGSGICVGVLGNAGSDIDNMGLVFLNPIARATLTNVRYPTLTADTPSVVPESLDTFSDHNTGSQPRNYRFSGSRAEEVSETWSATSALEVFMEVTVQAGIPEVASVSGKFGWKVSQSSTYSMTQKRTRTLTWESSGTIPPGGRISLAAITRRGRLYIPYTGEMVVTLRSGEEFRYNVSGQYQGVEYAGVEIQDALQAAALGILPLRASVVPAAEVREQWTEEPVHA
jgi:hypothetical protein